MIAYKYYNNAMPCIMNEGDSLMNIGNKLYDKKLLKKHDKTTEEWASFAHLNNFYNPLYYMKQKMHLFVLWKTLSFFL